MATEQFWLERVQRIRTWARGAERAPHKPLLLLFVLGHLQRTGSSAVSFAELERPLAELLREYGPPRAAHHPELPFFHLQTDGIWAVTSDPGTLVVPRRRHLLDRHAVGRLVPEFEAALTQSPRLLASIARAILDANFPESIHEDICEEVGLDLSVLEAARPDRPRDPDFRRSVLLAYEYRCAVCGYEGRMQGAPVALDAAHVRWRAGGGPDRVDNGLSLCSIHHKLLDHGAIGLTDDHRVLVSQHFIAHSTAAVAMVHRFAGAALLPPQPGQAPIAATHVAWHRDQVFKAPARAHG